MSKAEKLERAWRNGATSDVKEQDMLLVLRENGFELRQDRGNHWLAEHKGLANHQRFGIGQKLGRIKINCHYKGNKGHVHPFAVKDVLGGLTAIREEDMEGNIQ